MTGPKPMAERAAHARDLLGTEIDAWVCSASADGDAYVIPLTYEWDGAAMLFATPARSRTIRDLKRAGRTRITLPSTRDVVILDGAVEMLEAAGHQTEIDGFVAHHHWDPRLEPNPYQFFHFRPDRIQAWSVESELSTRDVMRGGRWLDPEDGQAT